MFFGWSGFERPSEVRERSNAQVFPMTCAASGDFGRNCARITAACQWRNATAGMAEKAGWDEGRSLQVLARSAGKVAGGHKKSAPAEHGRM
jgi:hypothetical protein